MKKPTISPKYIIFVLFIIVVEVIIFQYLYISDERDIENLSTQADALTAKVNTAQADFRRAQETFKNINLEEVGSTFSQRQNPANKIPDPQLLEEISRLADKLGITRLTVKSEPDEDNPYYSKRSFSITATTEFVEAIKFIDRLENELRLMVSNFSVQQNQNNPAEHIIGFVLSDIRLQDNLLPILNKNFPSPPATAGINKYQETTRDPFSPPSRSGLLQLAGTGDKPAETVEVDPDLLLSGIINLKKKKAAIINSQVVREGDFIQQYKLISIGRDRVVIGRNNKKYQLFLKKLASGNVASQFQMSPRYSEAVPVDDSTM